MSHLYSFSFAPNPHWSQRYARQPEILAYPNFVMMYGPNTNNGSILTMLEAQADFAVRHLEWMAKERIASIEVRRDVSEQYNARLQDELDSVVVWQAQPDGYYRGRSGKIVTQWPNTMTEYENRLRAVGPECFELISKLTGPQ
jgi:cation diffusion facilitator CzcD-associated flavoprotein CzcO